MHDYMNPFEFVPLPVDGPQKIPTSVAHGTPRLEGYLTYSLTTLTPLHITGKTTKKNNRFEKKCFYENYGKKVIPGSSLRGMIASFVEAFTGSDLAVFTRGDEKGKSGKSGRPAYGKHYDQDDAQKCRHVGFLMASADDPIEAKSEPDEYFYRGQTKKRYRYERNETLPPSFGRHVVDDAARFLFGYVDQENEKASAGRLIFEDLDVPENIEIINPSAWDLKGDAVFGSPNPRANTAWYFTPGEFRVRRINSRISAWEVLADKVRGRKFYFHQRQEACHEKYCKWKNLVKYHAQSVKEDSVIPNGRIYFTDLPETMLTLLLYSLMLPENSMAHKLGALKPFGFGSVTIKVNGLSYRDMAEPLKPIERQPLKPIESQGLKEKLVGSLIDQVSYQFLKKIMHFPEPNEKKDYLFIYPPFNIGEKAYEKKGFAVVERVYDSHPGHPTAGKSKKTTLFFDHYQMKAKNFEKVMGGKNYAHLLNP